MNYLFISILSLTVMTFTTILVALLQTTVGQIVFTVIAAWVASSVFGITLEDLPSSVWDNPWSVLDYL